MVKQAKQRGGRREGAGRPKGSRMRRSDELADRMKAAGKCPVDALVRLAEHAEQEGEFGQAIGAWKSILPYIYPKPKAVEFEPLQVVELAREIAAARVSAAVPEENLNYGERLRRAIAKLEDAQD
jgi:hypothetical protein